MSLRISLTLSTPLALVAIAELAGLVGAGGSAGWDNGAVKAGLGDNVDLDGGVATRVVDGACVNLGDRHFVGSGGRAEVSAELSLVGFVFR